jgi:excisionase family DNA binding protein
MQLLISTKEGARRLGIGKTTFFDLLKDGKIKAVRLRGRTLIHPAELERFAAALPRRACTKSTAALGERTDQAESRLGTNRTSDLPEREERGHG